MSMLSDFLSSYLYSAEPKPKDLPRDAEKKVPQDTTDSPSAAATANTHIDFPEISEKNLPELERLLNKQVCTILNNLLILSKYVIDLTVST